MVLVEDTLQSLVTWNKQGLFLFTLAEGEDFNGASNVLTFPPVSGSRTDCSAFSIIDDEVKEDDENFTISLNSTDRRISITVDEATVTIFGDDDSTYVVYNCISVKSDILHT